ncbi:MAG: HPF/RaiA family ribosome-associated protein [Burkholderiales bacterium]|nr:MAG: HPF/RaiA family ribosome-associated protein [Burkholderiales bacterium]
MQVQVNTDKNIEGREALERWATTELTGKLEHFRADVTRVEVHLSDENSNKGGTDKRCVMEARLAAHQPVAVTHHATGMDEAFRGAQTKLKHALESTLDRRKKHRDRESIRHDAGDGSEGPSA